jgi:hypothetical protein
MSFEPGSQRIEAALCRMKVRRLLGPSALLDSQELVGRERRDAVMAKPYDLKMVVAGLACAIAALPNPLHRD